MKVQARSPSAAGLTHATTHRHSSPPCRGGGRARGAAAIGYSKSRQDRSESTGPLAIGSGPYSCRHFLADRVGWRVGTGRGSGGAAPGNDPHQRQVRGRTPQGRPPCQRRRPASARPAEPTMPLTASLSLGTQKPGPRFPCGPLEVGYGGIDQARDSGAAPCPSGGRFLLSPSDASLPDLPSPVATGDGRRPTHRADARGGRRGRESLRCVTVTRPQHPLHCGAVEAVPPLAHMSQGQQGLWHVTGVTA
ncbi:hypothetical protein QFZ76_005024 [Streptomyces sp. V4I2]|nr:hypothetical protein [Streptomyces sp. V4I2]